MPMYTVYHYYTIYSSNRKTVATELTKLHTDVTGADPQAVKVIFFELNDENFFIGGERATKYVRVVAQISQGRTDNQKTNLFEGMNRILRAEVPKGEVQVQIQEIDDTKTVMTNGLMHTSELQKN